MSDTAQKLWGCLRLNGRVAGLALAGRWLSPATVAVSYDRIASHYDTAWLRHLRPVTDVMLGRLPTQLEGGLLDLGCGTGHSTAYLADRYPGTPITAVDISAQMLGTARNRIQAPGLQWVQAEMLGWLAAQPDHSAGLILAAWSLGYSKPARFLAEAGRVLAPNGYLAFVVNYRDTLAPIFWAFRRTLARFPEQVRLAAWPRFPRDWPALKSPLRRAGLTVEWRDEGHLAIPWPAPGERLAWLLQTGILAGFDAMLPLRDSGPVADYLESQLAAESVLPQHHWVSVIARAS